MNTGESITVAEAAKQSGVTRQAIHKAIAADRLKTIEVMRPNTEITIESFRAFKPNPKMRNCGPKAKTRKVSKAKTSRK